MGYDRRASWPVYRLDLDEQYPGLVVECFVPHHGARLAVARLDRAERPDVPAAAQLVELDHLLVELADCLTAWSLTEHGRPVPATHRELQRLDPPFLRDLLLAWRMTLNAPPDSDVETAEPEPEPGPEVALGLADLPHTPLPETPSATPEPGAAEPATADPEA